MHMNWIGTRGQDEEVFNPLGLGNSVDPAGGVADILPKGSLLIEAAIVPSARPVNLLRFSTLDPWPSGLTVCLEPDGTLRLLMRQGQRHLATALRTTLGQSAVTAHITYTWDAPARHGHLSVHLPDTGRIWHTTVMQPFPMSLRDAQRIICEPETCTLDEGVVFAAIADTPCPIGPLPTLTGHATVDTTEGPRLLRDMRAGDHVITQGSRPKRVLWTGHTTLPALGRFAPMTLRQPYMGLWDDLIAARDQRVCLAGSEVEYLFGEERVSTALRHLETRNCATPTKPAPSLITYYQILLETHEIITVNGASVESFDGSALLDNPAVMPASVLADLPDAQRPSKIGLAAPVLHGFEALTLTSVSIG